MYTPLGSGRAEGGEEGEGAKLVEGGLKGVVPQQYRTVPLMCFQHIRLFWVQDFEFLAQI